MTNDILFDSQKTTKQNTETRIANRAKSIFAAFGQVINDFYLESGIYFVGGFNAALVAWDIYTDLLTSNQPLLYAIAIAIIAFIAVEGLAVYLVGAAAKTNNGLLWFFSVVFAAFFTYAHYQEMTAHAGIISQYIMLAIPFFVVIGYWARTVKIDTENNQTQTAQQRHDEIARQQKLEDEKRAHEWGIQRLELQMKHDEKLARIEVKSNRKSTGNRPEISDRKNDQIAGNGHKPEILAEINSDRKMKKAEILDRLPGLVDQGLTNTEIGEIVGRNERTIRDYRKQLNGKVVS